MQDRGCPLCGAAHAACGHPSTSTPIDIPSEEGRVMTGPLRVYDVTVDGVPTQMWLTAEHAEQLGAVLAGRGARSSRDKARRPRPPAGLPGDVRVKSGGDPR